MPLESIGILSPGDMGHSVGAMVRRHGRRVFTCLEGRSERTRTLAAEAGLIDAGDMQSLVRSVDAVISIVVPSSAVGVAAEVAEAMEATNTKLLYVDCNAIAPSSAQAAAARIVGAGGRFADVAILGGPPTESPNTRFVVSGPGASDFAELSDSGLNIRVIDGDVGAASGLKMCFAAMSKGLQALGIELLVTARRLGIEKELREEQLNSQKGPLSLLQRSVPAMPTKAHRWVSEMEEIAQTFADTGFTPEIYTGVANLYRWVATTPLAEETPENRDTSRDLDGVIAGLERAVQPPSKK